MMELRLWKLTEFVRTDKTIDKIIILNLSDLLYFLLKFYVAFLWKDLQLFSHVGLPLNGRKFNIQYYS